MVYNDDIKQIEILYFKASISFETLESLVLFIFNEEIYYSIDNVTQKINLKQTQTLFSTEKKFQPTRGDDVTCIAECGGVAIWPF